MQLFRQYFVHFTLNIFYVFIYLFHSICWTFIPCAYAWSVEVFTFVQTNCGKKIQMSHRFGRTFIRAVYLWIRSTVSRGVKRCLLVCRGVFIALGEISRLRWVCGEDAAGLAYVSSGCFWGGKQPVCWCCLCKRTNQERITVSFGGKAPGQVRLWLMESYIRVTVEALFSAFFKNIFSGQSVLSQAGWSGQSETTEEEEKCCSRSKSSSLMANYTGLRPGRPQTKVQTEIKVCLGKMLPRCVKQRITHAMDRLLFVCVCVCV